jgi:hypothetical protein
VRSSSARALAAQIGAPRPSRISCTCTSVSRAALHCLRRRCTLPRHNSVRARSNGISRRSCPDSKINNGAITTNKLKRNSVTTSKVKDGSLLAADFKPGELPAGPPGPKGDPGAQGAKGDPGAQGSRASRARRATPVRPASAATNECTARMPASLPGLPPARCSAQRARRCSEGAWTTPAASSLKSSIRPPLLDNEWDFRVYNAGVAGTVRAVAVCANVG